MKSNFRGGVLGTTPRCCEGLGVVVDLWHLRARTLESAELDPGRTAVASVLGAVLSRRSVLGTRLHCAFAV